MGAIKGAREFRDWKEKKKLSRKQAMLAHCYQCNGEEEGAEDCLGERNCPLYGYFHYKNKKRQITTQKQDKLNLEPQNANSMADREA